MVFSMENGKKLIKSMGGYARVAKALGLQIRMIKRGAAEGFPALWFDALEKLAGQELPRHMFKFKELHVDDDQN